jgi:predicted Zn-dependent protease
VARCRTIFLISAVLIVLLSGRARAQERWQTFIHPQLGFSLSYPEGWTVPRNPTGIVFMAIGPEPAGVQGQRMNINVTYEEVRVGTTVDQFDAQNEAEQGMLDKGYRRLRTDKTLIDTSPAVIRYYIWKRDDGVERYQMQLVTIAGTQAYTVTGTTSTASARLADETKLLVSILLTFRPR